MTTIDPINNSLSGTPVLLPCSGCKYQECSGRVESFFVMLWRSWSVKSGWIDAMADGKERELYLNV